MNVCNETHFPIPLKMPIVYKIQLNKKIKTSIISLNAVYKNEFLNLDTFK